MSNFYYIFRQSTNNGKVNMEVVESDNLKKLEEKLRKEYIQGEVNIILSEIGGDYSEVWGDEFEDGPTEIELENVFIDFIRYYYDVEPLDLN